MATSESDDFESADEELNARKASNYQQINRPKKYSSIGSDSDDDIEYIPVQNHAPVRGYNKQKYRSPPQRKNNFVEQTDVKSDVNQMETKKIADKSEKIQKNLESDINKELKVDENSETKPSNVSDESKLEKSSDSATHTDNSKTAANKRERPQRQRKPKESLGAKRLGATKINKLPDVEATTPDEVRRKAVSEGKPAPLIQECWEEFDEKNLEEELKNAEKLIESKKDLKRKSIEEPLEVPEELKSNLKFKDIFKPDGWEGLGEDVELPDDLSDDKYHPVLDKLSSTTATATATASTSVSASAKIEPENTSDSWSGWGGWGVSSLLNTASVGVSTLTSHVSQGLSFLEESLGVPDPVDLANSDSPVEEKSEILEDNKDLEKSEDEKNTEDLQDGQSQYLPSFGFGNFMSSMSSITKLVESTSTKVISGGLDTLETIGKKTMEVLQEGDPGLKKKRAFFLNDGDKPILSQLLREAKEKADLEEKSVEEKELSRKIHFESLFDDYQGLVHLEALEMLSKQCNIKIQQQLVNLDGSELTSMQETLDEVKELCDLGDEDEDEEQNEKDLKQKLEEAWKDLGISMTYDKLIDSWNTMNSEISSPESKEISHTEIFQKSISALAQFTAYSVERFHKTAELLLIKERRSTVNEADSLVQLTKTLSSQIGCIANLYCNRLNELKEETNKSEINSSITTISLEATNASSYVQEAFRLLIPILQVGAI